jgi:probable dihydroxyacetone kinase regulator
LKERGKTMCDTTKRKIADCVKQLMRRQDISRITIQDVMEATGMSRQSFYYHFKDIYDVLEWIMEKDFKQPIAEKEYDSLEEWVCEIFHVIEKNRPFYEKIVSQIEWPRIIRHVKASLQEQMEQLLVDDANTKDPANVREWDSCMDIFATSFGYYMLDYIYRRRKLDDKKIVQDTGYIMMMLEKKECA